ncbi:MAG: hypothetical protein IIA78_05665, partial [Proteobacteria bacterium]|nr:hypothetical protein [Pseudomonadota bacterium]
MGESFFSAMSVLQTLSTLLVVVIGIVFLSIVVMYIVDVTQTQHAVRRNFPVIGRFRYMFEHMGEFFRQYFFAHDREEMPFNRAQRSWVYRAAKGLDGTVAFGSTLKPSENVRVRAFEVAHDGKQELLHRLIASETGRCLVFARTKRGTERLARRLNREGFAAALIHGDRSQSQRTAALTGFQQGRYRVLVATDLASRGIHVQ